MFLPPRSAVRRFRLCFAFSLTLGACAGGEKTGGNGGSATFGPATTTPPTDTSDSGDATNTTAPPNDDDTENDSDGPEPGTDGASESGDTSGSETEAGTDSASDGDPPSEQPVDGMYSDCLSAVECIGLTTCMTLLDGGGEVSDGFCTVGACMNAAASCDPSPGGTAMPSCFPIEQDGTPDNICALDCSGGATCPAGMECFELSAGSICA